MKTVYSMGVIPTGGPDPHDVWNRAKRLGCKYVSELDPWSAWVARRDARRGMQEWHGLKMNPQIDFEHLHELPPPDEMAAFIRECGGTHAVIGVEVLPLDTSFLLLMEYIEYVRDRFRGTSVLIGPSFSYEELMLKGQLASLFQGIRASDIRLPVSFSTYVELRPSSLAEAGAFKPGAIPTSGKQRGARRLAPSYRTVLSEKNYYYPLKTLAREFAGLISISECGVNAPHDEIATRQLLSFRVLNEGSYAGELFGWHNWTFAINSPVYAQHQGNSFWSCLGWHPLNERYWPTHPLLNAKKEGQSWHEKAQKKNEDRTT